MPVVTITSDFGLQDYYLAIIKGAIISGHPDINIVDITHNIQNYDIVQAAFVLKNAYGSFPKGSIHIMSINNFYADKRTYLALRFNGHYFLGPDNGVFSLMFGQDIKDIYELEYKGNSSFLLKEVYAQAVAHLAGGLPLNEIGIPIDEIEQRISFQPVISKSTIRGSVIHIDNYENAIVNISRELFEKVQNKRAFEISFKRHDPLTRLSRNYADVPVGETLCFFNSADFMEIAINMGKAGSLLGLQLEDSVQVDFLD